METRGHAPGVGQRRVGQNAAQRRAKIRVAAKFPRGGKADQNRQNDKRRGAAHVQHDVDGVIRIDPAVGFHHAEQAHQQAGRHNRGNDRHKDVGE